MQDTSIIPSKKKNKIIFDCYTYAISRKYQLCQDHDSLDHYKITSIGTQERSKMAQWNTYSEKSCYIASFNDYLDLVLDESLTIALNRDINRPYAVSELTKRLKIDQSVFCEALLSCDVIKDTAFIIAGWGASHPGHFLIETLPRILAYKYSDQSYKGLVYISEKTPTYILDRIKLILGSQKDNIRFFRKNCITFFEKPIVLGYCPQDEYSFHSGYKTLLFRMMKDLKFGAYVSNNAQANVHQNGKKLFATRRFDTGYKPHSNNREIINIELVEEAFTERGYEIVRFEDMTFLDTIEAVNNCQVLAGAYGSALHNSILSCTSPKVLSIGLPLNSTQAIICETLGQGFSSLLSRDPLNKAKVISTDPFATQYVNIERLREVLDCL